MTGWIWILLSPVIFLGPGLLPARMAAGPAVTGWTLVWAFFFSILLLPTAAFGLAMLLGTTVNEWLVIPLAAILGVMGLIFPGKGKKERAG